MQIAEVDKRKKVRIGLISKAIKGGFLNVHDSLINIVQCQRPPMSLPLKMHGEPLSY